MKQALINRAGGGVRYGQTASIPAPTGGWNARDPEAAMPPNDALWLENFFPGTSTVSIRKGAQTYSTGLGEDCQALMSYSSPSSAKLFAATTSKLFDVTTSGTVGTEIKAISSGEFCHVNFSVLGGSFLIAVNGVDYLQLYDGTTWKDITAISAPSITGIDTRDLFNINIFKRRLWFVEKDSMSAWYLPVAQIGGAASEFPLGQLFSLGGKLMAMGTWTIDGGSGVDDYAVFITSKGEVAVYKGTDPSSASDFNLVGVYYIGEPLGRKCLFKYGGDLALITQVGLFPLSKALLNATVDRSAALTDKINYVFNKAANAYGSFSGWSGMLFPKENCILINSPEREGFTSKQFIMNTLTGAWCLFSGWNAFCWENHNNELYFGGKGFVAKAFSGTNDFNSKITAIVKTAFSYFGSSLTKQFTLFRPIIKVDGSIKIGIGIDVDFEDIGITGTVEGLPIDSAIWDSSIWDQALWDADQTTRHDWRTAFHKTGFCAAFRLKIETVGVSVSWSSTDFVYKQGGVL